MLVEPGPLPPHERTWRHPSEVAAEERALVLTETSPRSTRLLALTTGTLGLLAVGLVMVTITPRPTESPVALSATTTPITVSVQLNAASGPSDRVGLRSDVAPEVVDPVLATPIGDGQFALITRIALADDIGLIDVRLPSGRRSTASIVTGSDDAVIVALLDIEPGREIARRVPDDADLVTVMVTPPVRVAFAEIGRLEVEEGTPVVDEDGALVGLCSRRSGGARLITVREALDDATNVVP